MIGFATHFWFSLLSPRRHELCPCLCSFDCVVIRTVRSCIYFISAHIIHGRFLSQQPTDWLGTRESISEITYFLADYFRCHPLIRRMATNCTSNTSPINVFLPKCDINKCIGPLTEGRDIRWPRRVLSHGELV